MAARKPCFPIAPRRVLARIRDRVRDASLPPATRAKHAEQVRQAELGAKFLHEQAQRDARNGVVRRRTESDYAWDRAEAQIAAEECADTYAGMGW